MKVLGLMVILAHASFKFGWAYRLFNYCTILIGGVPSAHAEDAEIQVAVAARRA